MSVTALDLSLCEWHSVRYQPHNNNSNNNNDNNNNTAAGNNRNCSGMSGLLWF